MDQELPQSAQGRTMGPSQDPIFNISQMSYNDSLHTGLKIALIAGTVLVGVGIVMGAKSLVSRKVSDFFSDVDEPLSTKTPRRVTRTVVEEIPQAPQEA